MRGAILPGGKKGARTLSWQYSRGKALKSVIYILFYYLNRVRNEEVRRRAGIERELASRADQRVLRWFGHVERIYEFRMDRRVLMAEVSGGRVRGRPRLDWMDVVKVGLGLQRNDGGGCATMRERSEIVEGPGTYVTMSFTRPFLLGTVFFRPPSRALVVITWRGVG